MASSVEQGRRKLQRQNEQLRQSERAKSELITIVAHELRTPLASILGYTSLSSGATPTRPRCADTSRSSTTRVAGSRGSSRSFLSPTRAAAGSSSSCSRSTSPRCSTTRSSCARRTRPTTRSSSAVPEEGARVRRRPRPARPGHHQPARERDQVLAGGRAVRHRRARGRRSSGSRCGRGARHRRGAPAARLLEVLPRRGARRAESPASASAWPSRARSSRRTAAASASRASRARARPSGSSCRRSAEPSVHDRAVRLEGIHHITCITADAPRNVEFYAGSSACASSRRRSTRTTRPSTTSSTPTRGLGRLRHHLLRVPGRARVAAPARGWSTASSGASPPTEALDFWQKPGRRAAPSAATGSLRFRDPEGLDARARRRRDAGRAARRRPSGDPGRARPPGLRLGARLHRRPGAEPAASSRTRWTSSRRRDACESRGERARLALRLRRRRHERGVGGRGHRPPRRLGLADGRARGVARAGARRPARARRR